MAPISALSYGDIRYGNVLIVAALYFIWFDSPLIGTTLFFLEMFFVYFLQIFKSCMFIALLLSVHNAATLCQMLFLARV